MEKKMNDILVIKDVGLLYESKQGENEAIKNLNERINNIIK